LTIDNTADNWLTAMFTAEYAGLFDVFLPALSQLRMPLPLGGSSNHFRTSTLRAVGAWDPYNVTEDADLGVRLARFGYRSVAIGSTTYEEAPSRFGLWLRQRTRWLKGWMQTWLVHMRHPWRLYRQLGLWPFLTVQLIVGGNVLAALIHPIMLAWLAVSIAIGLPLWSSYAAVAWFGTALAGGYITSMALGAAGLLRRGLVAHAWVLLFVPAHWLLLSLAAWRALYQLIRDPYRWEKTDHGLARTSRVGRRARLKTMLDEIAAVVRWRPQQGVPGR
jgi:cellulose synthase/poly-beta-1,6-N-acetylglucosamine synthase-like glycosyltransferase